MWTGSLILFVALFFIVQSKSVSKDDLVERLLENLKKKRLIPMSNRGVPGPVPDPSEQRPNMSIPTQNPMNNKAPEVVCLGKDNRYYRVGEQFGMFDNDCYYCKFDSTCNVYCDEDGFCRNEHIKKCLNYGNYYTIGHPVIPTRLLDKLTGNIYDPKGYPMFDDNCNLSMRF